MIGVSVPSGQSNFDAPAISIPPPRAVIVAGVLVLAEAVGLLVLAVTTLVSGLTEDIAVGRTLAQTGYYVVLALLLAACAAAILRGRRWGRTPCLVVQAVLLLIAVWLIAPSGQYAVGIGLLALAAVTGYLLLSKSANAWINRFPLPFAEPDQ